MVDHRASPLESGRKFTISKDYDVLITDIDEGDFERLSSELGVGRLSVAESIGDFPVRGLVYGENSRMFAPLVVNKRSIKLNVIFLYDTGSPSTYLRRDTFEALGYREMIPDTADVLINGVRVTVRLSRGHFDNVDLLGQDFLEKIEGRVITSYKEGTLVIDKQ